MRLSRLDLARFGKFSDRSIALPQSPQDFHLIVGPNEAGKSTLRSAIADLLYGIGKISPFNFVHAYGDMQLGAFIEHGGQSLEFVRTKGIKKTLTSNGMVLGDDALVPFLGATDRVFFDQMFGLDHDKLVRGGNEILNASNDIGQILFQSATGIGGLGEVRKTLEAEANALWGPKKSSEREYYMARDELDKADALLKQVTVRTKDWVDYSTNVARLGQEFASARERYTSLEQERMRLERMRRVVPALTAWRQKQSELQMLGEVIALPRDAATVLANAEMELATALEAHQLHQAQAAQLQQQRDALAVNSKLLQRSGDIQALTEMRQQVRNHEADIVKRQQEVDLLWNVAQSLARQLGWPADSEAELHNRLPPTLARAAIASHIKKYALLEQTALTTDDALKARTAERDALNAQATTSAPIVVLPALRAALENARNLGDVAAAERLLRTQIRKAEAELDAARIGLAEWPMQCDALRVMRPPATEQIDYYLARQSQADVDHAHLSERLADDRAAMELLELDIAQFQALHQPVTRDQVMQMRSARDNAWLDIRLGRSDIDYAATEYESKVAAADQMADLRHDRAQDATELQTKVHMLDRLRVKVAGIEVRLDEHCANADLLKQQWLDIESAAGLPAMPLLAVKSWLTARDKTLTAFANLTEAQTALDELMQRAGECSKAISAALERQTGTASQFSSLPALIVEAADGIESASQARIRHEELSKQRQNAEAAIVLLTARADEARNAMSEWQRTWNTRIAAAGLAPDIDTDMAEVALTLFARIEEALRSMHELRKNRIDAMRADLRSFEQQAHTLVSDIEQDLAGQSAATIAMELATRLATATAQDAESKRLIAELNALRSKADDAASRMAHAKAATQPLLHLAQAADHESLRQAIARSDAWHALTTELHAARDALHAGGDNLSIDELEAELDGADIATIPILLGEIDRERDELMHRLTSLSAEHASAEKTLAQIAGNDDAARAETQRQRALARMANAAERFAKVHTAARLLRWAIDRYRQTKQGPMLESASAIFASLTLGNFKRLIVDFDSHPLALEAQRSDGTLVGVTGLSDGTRDQLYLALRLAALELHLEQTQSLPFVADDLFINFDDARSKAGLGALAHLSTRTQVIFLSHHDHLVPTVQAVFGSKVNVVYL